MPNTKSSMVLANTTTGGASITKTDGSKALRALVNAGLVKKGAVEALKKGGREAFAAVSERGGGEDGPAQIATALAPALAITVVESAADETAMGKKIEETILIKPSTAATFAAATTLFLAPKRYRGVRAVAKHTLVAGLFSLAGAVGRRLPTAVANAAPKSGESKTSGAQPAQNVVTDA